MFAQHLIAIGAYATSDNSNIVYATQTVLMPTIRYFMPLVAAIFAPCVGFKQNQTKTHYTSMVAGLGCNVNGVAIAPDNDVRFQLDAAISDEDLALVNQNPHNSLHSHSFSEF